jgi:hypothetical protein
MTKNERYETLLAEFERRMAMPIPLALPRIEAYVSEELAEAVAANPASLRLNAKDGDGTIIIDRPRQYGSITVHDPNRRNRLPSVEKVGD